MNIDIRTLAVVNSIVNCLLAAAIILQYRLNRAYGGLGWWAAGYTSVASGFILLLFRDVVSIEMVSIIFANIMLLAGQIFIYIGTMRFLNKKENIRLAALIFTFFILSTFYVLFINRNDNARIVILYTAAVIIIFLTAQSLFDNRITSFSTAAKFNAAVFFAYGCFFTFRVVLVFIDPRTEFLFTPSVVQAASFFVTLTASVLCAFGFIIMVNQRLNAESREYLSAVINSTNDAIFIYDEEAGKIIDVNRSMCEMWGHTYEEAKILSIGDLSHGEPPYSRTDALEWFNRAKETGPQIFEWLAKRKNGEIFNVEVSIRFVVIGEKNYNVVSVHDMTERKLALEALRESERRLSDIIQFFPDPVIVIDCEGKVVAWNGAIENLTCVRAEDMLGKGNYEYALPFYGERRPVLIDVALHIDENIESKYSGFERSGNLITGEAYMPSLRGGQVYLYGTATALYNSHGDLIGAIESIRDITERKKTEEELTRIKKAVEVASNAIWLTDRKAQKLVYNNISFTRLFKYTGEELNNIGGSPSLFTDKTAAGTVYDNLKNDKSWSDEVIMRTGDNKNLCIYLYADVVKDEAGRHIGYLGIATDITEKKRIENELIESRQRMADIIQFFPDPVLVIDKERKVVAWNRAIENLTGITAEDMLGKGNYEYALPFYGERRPILIDLAVNSEQESEKKYNEFNRDGTLVTAEVFIPDLRGKQVYLTGVAIALYNSHGEIVGAIESIRDISERKKTEEGLRESEERYRVLFENMQDIFFRTDLNGKVSYVSPSIKIMGYSPEEAIGIDVVKDVYLYPEEREIFFKIINEKGFVYDYEIQFKNKDGQLVWVAINAHYYYDKDGNISGTEGIIRDISGRKKAEELLIMEKERLSITLRSIGDAVIVTDISGNVILINKVAENLLGWEQSEIIDLPLMDYFHIVDAGTRVRQKDIVRRVIDAGGIIELDSKIILINKNGTERLISDSAAPIKDKDSRTIGVIIVFRDITEKQKMEDELLKTQKLESIGIIAGGIAHDFNNILTGIIGYISLARRIVKPEDRIYNMLSEVEKASMRATNLTQQLLTFSKGWAPVRKTVQISDLLKEAAAFVLSGTNIKCNFFIQDNLWPVEIDEGQIIQVINNLIINARQAMPDGGAIEISAENIDVDVMKEIPLKGGKYIMISIKDQGTGIPEEIQLKIFDPFFTTRVSGNGLGLSTSYSIIRKHDGYITLKSKPGSGTRFYIYLPASEKLAGQNGRKVEIKTYRFKGRVLLMDDEEIIRNTAADMLTFLGFEVDSAREGTEAIDMFVKAAESDMPYDLVIMDLTIPGGLGGKDAIKKFREIDPLVKVIVSSGYSNDPIMSDFRKYGFSGIIVKPYKIDDLYDELKKIFRAV